MRIAILAGEASGDALGAGLMHALRRRNAHVCFIGVGGPLMTAAGLQSLLPFDAFGINGLTDPLLRLPQLWRMFRALRDQIVAFAPDAFIGVDFNVFNLLLERALKRRGVRTVHYVSPSVYAWRRGRLKRMRHSTDLMLTLFPFEAPLYRSSGVAAVFVGHPLADEIIGPGDPARARRILGVDGAPLIALLPGSRSSEVNLLGRLFLRAAEQFLARHPQAHFVVACIDARIAERMERLLRGLPLAPHVTLVTNQTRLALTAADAALVKSGTGTLEAMLLERPMVVAYRLGALTAFLVRRLLRTPHVALPNILAGKALVPEFLQEAATAPALAAALADLFVTSDLRTSDALRHPAAHMVTMTQFRELGVQLRRNASDCAAAAVVDLVQGTR